MSSLSLWFLCFVLLNSPYILCALNLFLVTFTFWSSDLIRPYIWWHRRNEAKINRTCFNQSKHIFFLLMACLWNELLIVCWAVISRNAYRTVWQLPKINCMNNTLNSLYHHVGSYIFSVNNIWKTVLLVIYYFLSQ